jgi:hypothetical protein
MTESDLPLVEEYVAAFKQIAQRLTSRQRRMIEYHAAKDGPVSARELADIVGYRTFAGVNLQYGKVGTYLRAVSPAIAGLEGQQSYAFAKFEHPPGEEWLWYMHEPAIIALRQLGWVQRG